MTEDKRDGERNQMYTEQEKIKVIPLIKVNLYASILQCDYSNQSHLTRFSTNLTNENRGDYE